MHLEAARRIGVPFSECLVIEDSIKAIGHARENGAGIVIGIGEEAAQPELLKAGADYCICDFTEFHLEWLKSWHFIKRGGPIRRKPIRKYSNIDPEKTVEIANYLRDHAAAGETYFYDIYTDEEKASDPAKEDTGLFFFKGNPGEKFAVCNAGGGFAYVGAMQDSFPHALELSKMGYNAFALIYRPGAQTACEDLAIGIYFKFLWMFKNETSIPSPPLYIGLIKLEKCLAFSSLKHHQPCCSCFTL